MVEATETAKSLQKAYKFSDYEVEEWLTSVLNCKTNSEFKTLIGESTLI